MTKKRCFIYVCCLSFMLLMAGCDNKDGSPVHVEETNKDVSIAHADDTNHNLEAKIVELEQIIEKQQLVLEEHEKMLTRLEELDSLSNWIDILLESSNTTDSRLYELDTLIKQVTSSKTAIINDIMIQGNTIDLSVTYTNIITGDEEGPGGFRLEETEEGTKVISVSNNVPVFKLKDPGTLIPASFDEISDYERFVRLFEKDGEIVFISELYLP